MSLESKLSKQKIAEAEQYGGASAWEDNGPNPENTPYFDDLNHLERLTAHSPNHLPHLERAGNGRKKKIDSQIIGQPLEIPDKEGWHIKRRKSNKPRS